MDTMQIKVNTKLQCVWLICEERFFRVRNSQNINYDMHRLRETIFLEKVIKKNQVLYHCQKHTGCPKKIRLGVFLTL